MVLSPIVSVLQPRHRNVALNFLHAFYCIGAVLTILVASQALAHGVSWRMATVYIIPFPLLVALGYFFAGVPPLIGEGSVRTPLRALCRDSFFLLAMAAIALGGATELGLAYWMPTYAQKDLHFSKAVADNAFLGFSLAMAVGRLGLGLIEHRIDAIALLMICCVASALLFVAGAAAPPGWALAACILTGLSGSILWPSTLALASDRYPHGGATMFAVLGALGNAGGITMPWIMGVIADHFSLALGVGSGALCAVLMIVALIPMAKLRRAHAAAKQ
jgi:fucose permease